MKPPETLTDAFLWAIAAIFLIAAAIYLWLVIPAVVLIRALWG